MGSVTECSGCGLPKPLVAFATFTTRLGEVRRRGICKKCRHNQNVGNAEDLRKYRIEYNKRTASKRHLENAARRATAKEFVDNIKKDRPCVDCGHTFPLVAMDFDHVRGEKARSISGLVSGAYKIELIAEEIAKCEIVCACCHRIRTANRKENVTPPVSFRSARAHLEEPPIVIEQRRHGVGDLVRGSKAHNTKLNEGIVLEIRRRAEGGERPMVLATEFGVSGTNIYRILRGDTWNHVDGVVRASSIKGAYRRPVTYIPVAWRNAYNVVCAELKMPQSWRDVYAIVCAKKTPAVCTPEQRSEVARKRYANLTPEQQKQRGEAIGRSHATRTPEQRSETARKKIDSLHRAHAAKTPEQRSEIVRRAQATRTPEQRSETMRKAWVTRRGKTSA